MLNLYFSGQQCPNPTLFLFLNVLSISNMKRTTKGVSMTSQHHNPNHIPFYNTFKRDTIVHADTYLTEEQNTCRSITTLQQNDYKTRIEIEIHTTCTTRPDTNNSFCPLITLRTQEQRKAIKLEKNNARQIYQCSRMSLIEVEESLFVVCFSLYSQMDSTSVMISQMSREMRFPTMWYVRPAKPQIRLRIRAV